MYNHTLLTRILKLLPRTLCEKVVKKHNSDRYYKTFKTKEHCTALVIGQLCGANSLRELTSMLKPHVNRRYPFNVSTLKRSTLADANQSRSAAVFADLAAGMSAHLKVRRNRRLLTS